jgi:hypothetical protein
VPELEVPPFAEFAPGEELELPKLKVEPPELDPPPKVDPPPKLDPLPELDPPPNGDPFLPGVLVPSPFPPPSPAPPIIDPANGWPKKP